MHSFAGVSFFYIITILKKKQKQKHINSKPHDVPMEVLGFFTILGKRGNNPIETVLYEEL